LALLAGAANADSVTASTEKISATSTNETANAKKEDSQNQKYSSADISSNESQMKTIGIIGGVSWVSSIEYYRLMNEMVNKELGGLHSAKVLMYSSQLPRPEGRGLRLRKKSCRVWRAD
jgi:menaquinone-dependent protoporphyrinogen IX oxidase